MFNVLTWMQDNQDWIWLAIGVVLLIGEILAPGVFLLWIGLAGLATGLLVMVVPDLSFEIQGMIFAILSIVAVFLGRKVMKGQSLESDEAPTLNKKGATMVGQLYVLATPIENGEGKVKVGDSLWIARCETDIPEGQKVQVAKVEGTILYVQAIGE